MFLFSNYETIELTLLNLLAVLSYFIEYFENILFWRSYIKKK